MVTWVEASDDTRYGVAISNLEGNKESKPKRIGLCVGDTVHILKKCEGWYYGHTIKNKHEKGLFPSSFIQLKEAILTKSGSYETITAKESPIVQEITAVLREWGTIWKELYTRLTHDSSEQATFDLIGKKMENLIDWRKRVMQRKFTVDEMKEVQRKVTNIIDMGNAKLGLDLVVRDAEGNIMVPTQTSTIQLFRQHEIATKRIEQEKQGTLPGSSTQKSSSFNLCVNIKGFVCNVGDNADMLISLYDSKAGQFISESYIAKYGDKGLPRNLEMLHNMKCLFTDLGQKDIAREKVFLVCQIVRVGRMLVSENENKKETIGLRRPFGIAAIEVTEIIKSGSDVDEKQLFIPLQACGEREAMDSVIKKITSAKEINHKGQGVYATIRKIHADLQQIQKEYPHLVAAPTAVSRKMGFPDVIMPDDVRNDLYVTLLCGEFRKGYGLSKTQDKNIEITMEVCNQFGAVIPDVICEGAGGEMLSQYKSVIYYHEDKPKWCETIKVAIPINDFYGSHLKFQFRHRPSNEAKDKQEKPFAVSYLRLMHDNGTVVSNSIHDLLVYKIDPKIKDKQLTYLKVPSTVKEVENRHHIGNGPPNSGSNKQLPAITSGALTMAVNDAFQISSLVCSTKLPHNLDLIGLLKWRDNPALLKNHLMQFTKIDGEEIVKFLQDVLDSLFNIFMQNSDSDIYDNLVFEALIFLVNLVNDRKYHQFRSVLDVYIKDNFSATLAYNKLMVVLKDHINHLEGAGNHESILKAMKAMEYMFKFIIRSRILFAALNEQRGKQQFEIAMMEVFQVLTKMMQMQNERLLLIQEACLKYVPLTLTDIISVFSPSDLGFVLMQMVKSIKNERLSRHKLLFINDLVHSDIFKFHDCRKIMLPVMMDEVNKFLEQESELEICIRILSDITHFLYAEDPSSTKEDINTIMMNLLRTIIQTIIHVMSIDRNAPLIANAVAVLISILRQMEEFHYKKYLSHFDTDIDLLDFLMEILMSIKDLVMHNVFPSDWNEMIMLQNSIFLKALRHFSCTVREHFTTPCEYQLWQHFFECAISFLTQDPLQLENFSTTKRNKIISRYNDMRREAGFEIRNMWFSLGQHKIKFIPGIVGAILQMTLIPETELRKATIPIFFDMMHCEFTSLTPNRSTKNNFHKFEDEFITQLDTLIEEGVGDEPYNELLYSILCEQCLKHETMKQEGLVFVEMVKDLLRRLLAYRDVMYDDNKENKMSCVVALLNFYEEINRRELYVLNLHKLVGLHLECDNFTEAACSLMNYAKLLNWSDSDVPDCLKSTKYTDALTQRQLKEKIYYDIIGYFDKGKMWEKGLEMCKELVTLYEAETFDYIQLSKILKKQADFYDCIMNHMRAEPEYFRVGYYGLGFPSFLQNSVFVYRGKDFEKIPDFSARLQNLFPNATMMKSLNPPSDEQKRSTNQYLQINAVTPVMELRHHLKKKKVHDQILKYYRVNEVQTFTFSRKKDESKNDLANMWLDRTNVTISSRLPGILRWFPVTQTQVVEVSPLENALETMDGTNGKIQGLVDQYDNDPNMRVDPLSMVLNGVVDAAVNGGITNFKVFYQEQYLKDHPSHSNLVTKLKDVTTLQILLLHLGLDIHRKRAPESLMPFQAHMDQRFSQMKVFIDQDYGIQLTKEKKQLLAQKHQIPLTRIQTMPSRKIQIPGQTPKLDKSPSPLPNKKSLNTARSVSAISRTSSIPTISTNRDSPTKVYTRTGGGSTHQPSPRSSIQPQQESTIKEDGSSPQSSRINVRADGEGGKLTASRPPRPQSNRLSRSDVGSRPGSDAFITPPRLQPNNRTSNVSMMSNTSDETFNSNTSSRGSDEIQHDLEESSQLPPPLPSKHMNGDEARPVLPAKQPPPKLRRPSHDKAPAALPGDDQPPPLVPKKRQPTILQPGLTSVYQSPQSLPELPKTSPPPTSPRQVPPPATPTSPRPPPLSPKPQVSQKTKTETQL